MKVTANVQRSGDWWAIEVPEVPGVFTQAKRLEQVADQVRDAVATMLDGVNAADIEVTLSVDVAAAAVADVRAATAAAQEASERASVAMREAVRRLRGEERLTTRDTAEVLGVSHQRVSQIEKTIAAR